MLFKSSFLTIAVLIATSLPAQAEEIVFSPEVLPTESIFPSLDSQDMVRNRKLEHKKRIETKVDYLWGLDQLFNAGRLMGLTAYYHLNNDIGLGLKYYAFSNEFNDYAKAFQSRGVRLDYAPQPQSIFALSLVNRIMYGKISWSQDTVMPLTIDLQYDLGVNKYGSAALPYGSIGASHKLFFQKNVFFDLSYYLQVHQVVNPVSVNLRSGAAPAEDSFEKKMQFSQALSIGLGYLFN